MTRAGLVILGCLSAGAATAQSSAAPFFNPLSASRSGIHLYGVSFFGGYFSGGSPFGLLATSTTPTPGASAVMGGSTSLGWSRTREASSLALSETLSYVVYPERHVRPNTSLTLNWNRKVGRTWSFHVSVTGLVSDLQQTYFTANAFGLAASLPTTFDDLAGAMLSGKFTDAQLASALTGTSARVLPEQTYLYGRTIGSASVTASFEHTLSGRSQFHGSLTGTRVQGLDSGAPGGTATPATIRQSTSGSVSLGWGYSLSPRTHIGLEAATTRAFSQLQDGYASTATISVGRTMSEHWFVDVRAGGGVLTYLRQAVAKPKSVQYTAGGSIGYKLRSHTLLGSVNRSIGDSYGLGSASTNAATAGWAWKAPGSLWSVSANFGYQKMNGSAVGATESWRATGGIARALSPHLFVNFQYAYFTFPSNLLLVAGMTGAENGVSMGLSWSPSQYR